MGQVPSELLRDGLLVRDLRQRQWKHANCLLSVTVRARADDAKHGVSTPSRRCDWESQDRVLRARLVRRVLEWYCVTHYRTSLDRVTVSCLKHNLCTLLRHLSSCSDNDALQRFTTRGEKRPLKLFSLVVRRAPRLQSLVVVSSLQRPFTLFCWPDKWRVRATETTSWTLLLDGELRRGVQQAICTLLFSREIHKIIKKNILKALGFLAYHGLFNTKAFRCDTIKHNRTRLPVLIT